MAFLDLVFPPTLALGAVGGPRFRTTTAPAPSGDEALMAHWALDIGAWELAQRNRTADETQTLLALFRLACGRAHGFLFPDPGDNTGVGELLGTGDGIETVFALVKHYAEGALTYTRPIRKPVAGSVTICLNGTPTTAVTVSTQTGRVTFATPPGVGVLITAFFLFHVPVRFDLDQCSITCVEPGIYTWGNIRLVELAERAVPCVAVPDALAASLVLCLDLEEPTGSIRYDSVGTTDVSPLNGVRGLRGKNGLAAHFVAAEWQSLTVAATADTTLTGPFTLAFWMRPHGTPASAEAVLSQGLTTAAGQYEWWVLRAITGKIAVSIGGGFAGVVTSTEAPAVDTWSFVLIWHDGTTLRMQVNNDTIDSDTGSTFTVGGSVPFNLGAIGHTTAADHSTDRAFYNGGIDSVMLFQGLAMTSQGDRDLLWNSGAGVRCLCP